MCSKTIVVWMRSPPPKPPLPEAAVLIVCRRYPSAACLLITFRARLVGYPHPAASELSHRHLDPVLATSCFVGVPPFPVLWPGG